jgi:prevent-host-death family protein
MLEFRNHAEKIIRRAKKGQSMILSYRGKPVMRLEPIRAAEKVEEDDSFYKLSGLVESDEGSLSNRDIDGILYGK